MSLDLDRAFYPISSSSSSVAHCKAANLNARDPCARHTRTTHAHDALKGSRGTVSARRCSGQVCKLHSKTHCTTLSLADPAATPRPHVVARAPTQAAHSRANHTFHFFANAKRVLKSASPRGPTPPAPRCFASARPQLSQIGRRQVNTAAQVLSRSSQLAPPHSERLTQQHAP